LVVLEGDADEVKLRRDLAELLEPAEMPRRLKCVAKIPSTPLGKRNFQAALQLLNQHD